jgi:hypothetical protein
MLDKKIVSARVPARMAFAAIKAISTAISPSVSAAALNGLDPAACLRTTLEILPTCLNSEIDSLLPLRDAA